MRKIIFILFILFMPFVLAMPVCEDTTDIEDIPCEVITPVITCPDDNYYFNLSNAENGTHIESGNLTSKGDGTYNFSFNYSYGTYTINVCNATATSLITITDISGRDDLFYFYGIVIFLGVLILIIGKIMKDYYFGIISGIIFMIFAIYVWINGLIGIQDQFIINLVAVIIGGVGAYLILKNGYDAATGGW